jgi:hypothetical protein
LYENYIVGPGTSVEKVNEWGKESFDHFSKLFYSPDAALAGVALCTAYVLLEGHEDHSLPSWRHIVPNFKSLCSKDISQLGLPNKFVAGCLSIMKL